MKHTQLVKSSVLLWLVLAMPAWAGVGYIQTLNGPSESFTLLRGSKQETVVANKSLEVGDKIRVLKNDPKFSLTLLLDNGELVPLTYQNTHPTPYPVTAGQPVPGVLKGFMNTVQGWFTDLQEHHVHLVSLYSRGEPRHPEPLSMPLLMGDQTLLQEGKTTLFLGWQGGQSKYRVQVTLEGARKIWRVDGLQATSVTLDNFSATPGRYLVEVSDAKGQSVRGNFQVVANSTLLQDAQVQAIQHLPVSEDNQQTLLASWLAQQPRWRLEAYQQVADIAKRFEPALLVKEGLEGGIGGREGK
jgi:hypothetical protein